MVQTENQAVLRNSWLAGRLKDILVKLCLAVRSWTNPGKYIFDAHGYLAFVRMFHHIVV